MIKLKLENREDLLATVERWTEIPMLILVIIMIVTLVIPFAIELDEATHQLLELIDWIIWGAFAVELLVKTYIAPRKIAYLRKNWLDVIVVALPLLRVFRIFRVARLARGARVARSTRALRLLRFSRLLAIFGKFTHEAKTVLSRHGFHYLFVILLTLIGLGTILINYFDQEFANGANNWANSLWLTIVNAFSGGYANVYPESPEAKGISVVLIVLGTVIVSYFTASLASYFTEKGQDVEQERIEKKLDNLIEEVKKIRHSGDSDATSDDSRIDSGQARMT